MSRPGTIHGAAPGSPYCVPAHFPASTLRRAVPLVAPGERVPIPRCAHCGPFANSSGGPMTCTRCGHVDRASWTARCMGWDR